MSKKKEKIVMTLLVRDEEDIIDQNIAFHLQQGIDFIIVTNNLSVDNTPKILEKYEKLGVVSVINEYNDDYNQSKWVTKMAKIAIEVNMADWVINADADEFWRPVDKNKSLRECLAEQTLDTKVLKVMRYNYFGIGQCSTEWQKRLIFKDLQSTNTSGKPLLPKVIHRKMNNFIVGQGNHWIEAPFKVSSMLCDVIEICHFPFRSYEQYENKISKGGAAYNRNKSLPKNYGKTWRRSYDILKQGKLKEEYSQYVPKPEEIEKNIQSGRYVRDTSIRDWVTQEFTPISDSRFSLTHLKRLFKF